MTGAPSCPIGPLRIDTLGGPLYSVERNNAYRQP